MVRSESYSCGDRALPATSLPYQQVLRVDYSIWQGSMDTSNMPEDLVSSESVYCDHNLAGLSPATGDFPAR